jgi:hypothetical protein
MKRISYAGNSVLTGDDIADAVVHYAEALARNESAATVEMPVFASNGSLVTASLLIGPASQLVAVPEPADGDDVLDAELVRVIEERTRSLASLRPIVGGPSAAGLDQQLIEDLEYPGTAD